MFLEQLSDRATCSGCVLWWINRNSHTGAESGLTHGPPHLLLQAVAQQALLFCYRVPDIRSFSIFFLTRWFVVINSHKSTCSTTLNSHSLTLQWYPTLAHLLEKKKKVNSSIICKLERDYNIIYIYMYIYNIILYFKWTFNYYILL